MGTWVLCVSYKLLNPTIDVLGTKLPARPALLKNPNLTQGKISENRRFSYFLKIIY